MFYRLLYIDSARLPAPVVLAGRDYTVTRGGLLLEPPRPADMPARTDVDGYSILRFFGHPAPGDASDFLASSREAYRWLASGEIDISRREADVGARFRGVLEAGQLRLRADDHSAFLPAGTRLTFMSDPNLPIPEDWYTVFDFGPPLIQPSDPSRAHDPVVLDAIRRSIEAEEPGRRRAARERLETAWRAPA